VKRHVDREQFFSSSELASRCVAFADEVLDLSRFSLIVEPSAGAGAFYDLLPEAARVGIDIAPQRAGLEEGDFLTWTPSSTDGHVLTIGNPPFGQRAALAIAFLDHACTFSDAVAFVLPRSFNKYTFQDRVHPFFHLEASIDCDEPFSKDGREVMVKTTFQVWTRRTVRRVSNRPPSDHPHFTMRHCHLSRTSDEALTAIRKDFPFSIPQVGADFSPRDSHEVSRGSHWFIRPNVAGVRARFERLDFSFLANMNTAHMSLSKRDIVWAYGRVLESDGEPLEGATGQLDLFDVPQT
jgi:hypothetical protein